METEWGEIGDLKVKGYFEMREWSAWNDSEKSSKMENVKKKKKDIAISIRRHHANGYNERKLHFTEDALGLQ